MSSTMTSLIEARFAAQPDDVHALCGEERNRLVISTVQVGGLWVIRSQYGDDIWHLTGGATNLSACQKKLDFHKVPPGFRAVAKELMYLYHRHGRVGCARPKPYTMWSALSYLIPFLKFLDRLKLRHLGAVTPMVCVTYVAACKAARQARKKGKPLSAATLSRHLQAVEFVYELSQLTATPMPSHPWPESTATILSDASARNVGQQRRSKTPLIPDEVFTSLFQEAYALVQRGKALLDIRDALGEVMPKVAGKSKDSIWHFRNDTLKALGWEGGFGKLTENLGELQVACYIVIASLSGCRNHELTYLQDGAYYRTEDDECEATWWMRSQSDKTGTGKTEWMVPEAAVEALRVMDRWAAPYQALLEEEITQRRAKNPQDPEIGEAQRHVGAIFVGPHDYRNVPIRTLSLASWNQRINAFSERRGIGWFFSTHQFRRKFANYAARSQFGDLRYLREHFKHWSQDMTNDTYALNESQEMELYAEIQDELDTIKLGLVEQWLDPTEPLAGGYGKNLMAWRSREEEIIFFRDHATMVKSVAESHAIRSNGHAWCTADDKQCIGNTFEKTRCSGCDNGVIGRFHARMYQNLYADLKELAMCDDIGPGGQARVQRDLERCIEVLVSLGYDPETTPA